MKKKIALVLLVAVAVLAVSSCSHRRATTPKNSKRMVNHIARKLDLSDEQKEEVTVLVNETFKTFEARRSAFGDEIESANILFLQDELKADDILSVMEEHESEREEMKRYMADQMVRFHAILTPEQREKFVEEMDNFKSKRHR